MTTDITLAVLFALAVALGVYWGYWIGCDRESKRLIKIVNALYEPKNPSETIDNYAQHVEGKPE